MFIYRSLLILFLLLPLIFYSQEKKKISVFFKSVEIKSQVYNKDFFFHKAQSFFLEKKWDSTLIYTAKLLNVKTKNTELNNYTHFFRGYSLKKKRIFEEAKREFSIIKKSFYFYDRIAMYLAEIAVEQEEYHKAISYFKKIESLKSDAVIGVKKSSIFHNMGVSYFHLNKYKKAEFYLTKSINIIKRKKDTFRLISSYADIGNLYYAQYKDAIAIPFYKKAYLLSKDVQDFETKGKMAKNMAVVEENRKNLTAALKYRKEYEKWKDSLNNQNRIWETAQLEKKHAVQQKQQEVNVLQIENRAKTAEISRILYTVISLLVLLSIIIYFFRKNIKSKKIIGEQNKRLNDLNATKDKLFSIVSHDLRSSVNTLKLSNKKLINNLKAQNINVVYELLQKNSAIVGSAYNLLDNLLNWALLQTKQSYFEIKEMHLFFAVEHLVYNYLPFIKEKELHFESTISKSAKVLADQESLKIILRNLLDNAIKFSEPNDKIKIYIETSKEGFLDIVVEDSGIGMSEKTVLQLQKDTIAISEKENKEIIGSGLGFQLCKSMIKKNNGRILVESELGKGTKMIVSLPKPFINE